LTWTSGPSTGRPADGGDRAHGDLRRRGGDRPAARRRQRLIRGRFRAPRLLPRIFNGSFGASLAALCALASPALAQQKWEPNKPIEIIVNAGAGGATDQLARTLQSVCAKHNLTTQPFIVTIKPGAGGAEGMMDAKNSKGDATKLFIGNTGLYPLPLATKLPFNWRDLTPVAVIAMDEFCLFSRALPAAEIRALYLSDQLPR
jgi:hypothetical protein